MEKFSSSNFFQLPRGRAFTGSASSSQNFPAPLSSSRAEFQLPGRFQLPALSSSRQTFPAPHGSLYSPSVYINYTPIFGLCQLLVKIGWLVITNC